jgi:hypothetical protein
VRRRNDPIVSNRRPGWSAAAFCAAQSRDSSSLLASIARRLTARWVCSVRTAKVRSPSRMEASWTTRLLFPGLSPFVWLRVVAVSRRPSGVSGTRLPRRARPVPQSERLCGPHLCRLLQLAVWARPPRDQADRRDYFRGQARRGRCRLPLSIGAHSLASATLIGSGTPVHVRKHGQRMGWRSRAPGRLSGRPCDT